MRGSAFQFTCLSDPRFAAHALSASPAWLWSAEAGRFLWANPTGAAIFDASSPGALASTKFDSSHPAAAQVARLAATLPQDGAPRLERLRGFGARFGGMLACHCSRITLADNEPAVLVVATERASKDLSLPERAQRLLTDIDRPAAIFSADGEPIEMTPAARERLGSDCDLIAIGAENLAHEAMLNGQAEGEIPVGAITLLRLGAGPKSALLLAFDVAATQTDDALASPDVARPADEIPGPPATDPEAEELPARRVPFRFVWQMDAAGRFTLGDDEFARLLGPETASALDGPWAEIADTLKLDPQGAVTTAIAAHDTWSGIVVQWPLDGEDERLPVEMSGLPVFDRDRAFAGYRGFGVCREVDRVAALDRRRPPLQPRAPKPQEPDNVLPFPAPEPAPALSESEHSNFQELAQTLSARLRQTADKSIVVPDDFGPEPGAQPELPPQVVHKGDGARDMHDSQPILDRLPVGILVYRLNTLLYGNRAFLEWTGYSSLAALSEAGGLDSLFIENTGAARPDEPKSAGRTLTIATVNGKQKPVEGRLFSVAWNGESALVLMISVQDAPAATPEDHGKDAELSLRRIEAENRELKAMLDTATDGVLVLDRNGRVLSANRSAEALFGHEAAEFVELGFTDLLAPESRRAALEDLERLAKGPGAGMLNAGREMIGLVRQGGLVPLYVTIGRLADGENFCAVLRDVTAWKRTEEELTNATQDTGMTSGVKSEFLAKISHEIRTPLNAIIGFSEVMLAERFGPIGNERYRQYLQDIQASGGYLISLLNDLLDLSKVETGKLELTFVNISLNDLVQQGVAIMQPQANRERVIIRTSLPASLPQIVADARSVRQIALNLLSNSIKFTGAGGQVIVSTALTDANEVILRVRDTGAGMSEKELKTALEPFGQLAAPARMSGSGLGLPISKALAEANRARFHVTSQVNDGTLVEVAFPATRVLAE